MSKVMFEKLKETFGEKVVWKVELIGEGVEYIFTIGDKIHDETCEEQGRSLEDGNFECCFCYSYDLLCNVVVKDLDKLTKEQVDFLEKHVGPNNFYEEDDV